MLHAEWHAQSLPRGVRLWALLVGDEFLMAAVSKHARMFTCMSCPVISMMYTVRYINTIRSPDQATAARGRAPPKGHLRPFIPTLINR